MLPSTSNVENYKKIVPKESSALILVCFICLIVPPTLNYIFIYIYILYRLYICEVLSGVFQRSSKSVICCKFLLACRLWQEFRDGRIFLFLFQCVFCMGKALSR